MERKLINAINITRFTFCIFLAFIFWVAGCASPVPDPLAGWHFSSLNNLDANRAIMDDYQGYIQKLSSEERKYVGFMEYFEDGTGQHAVKITIGLNGTNWRHILIYDKDDRRIKIMKYVSGHSAS